ncbi:unnamed protein product [Brachionus calyciflorus]|uniref:Nanos-type domain-containing protein n=1 Tax=Brachionus calyciflorus TaxID=104777 RepID=A0A814LBN2_9BILA|nr:unnamed protein product [Brachionus calyciflorus]
MSIVSENVPTNRQIEINQTEELNQNIIEEEENDQLDDIENKQLNVEKIQTVLNVTSNSSGIGGSIGSPNFDAHANNSIYTAYGSSNTNDSIPATPSTPTSNYEPSCDSAQSGSTGKINVDAPIFNMTKTSNFQVPIELMNKINQNLQRNNSNENLSQDEQNQEQINPMYFQGMNNFHSLPIGLGNNSQFDYDLFNNEYSGIDKQLAMQMGAANQNVLDAVIGNKKNLDAQKQQQLLAQAIAAAVQQNTPNAASNENQSKNQQRSLMDNIEQLNSKFLNQKQYHDQNVQMNKNVNLNSLLAAAASLNQSGNDSMNNFGSPNSNTKRQSTGAFMNPNVIFSTPIPASTSPNNTNTINNRINSTPTIPEQNRFYPKSNNPGNVSPDKINSMSASNSSFNLDIGNNNPNGSVNSGYEDDDVFTNTSLNFNQNANNANMNPLLMGNQKFDMYQFYQNLLASNLNSSNINEFLLNQTQNLNNLSNLSLSSATDILNQNNSQNFLNLTGSNNSTFNQLKMNSFNQSSTNNSNNNGANNNMNNLSNLNNQLNLSPALAAAVLKQRQQQQNNQMMNNSNNRLSTSMMNNQSNNMNQNNMASFLNSSQNQSQFMNGGNDVKRRINSIATAYNLGNNSNQSPLFQSASTHNVGPNASQLLQQSSLVSSARLNSSAANQSTASVLGNNSSLTHTLNSLQSGQMMPNQDNFGNLNSSPLPSSNHNLFSALSLSSSAGTSLTSTLLSSSGKPLRSERLPPQMVDEIIKQAKIRRKQGGKKEVCVFCRNNGEKEQFFASHTLKDAQNNVACPVLRLYQCPICHANGDQAHTIKYCPYAEKDSPKMKEFGRFAAAALLMNSFNGSNTPPSGSPPETPSPLNHTPQSHQLSFLSQSVSPNISSPNNPFAHALNQFNNFNNFNMNNVSLPKNDLNLSLNKSVNNHQGNSSLLAAANNPTKSNLNI